MADPELRELIAEVKLEFARNREVTVRGLEKLDRMDERAERRAELDREQHERGLRTYERLESLSVELSDRNERVAREMIRELSDLRGESQAQREALLRILDEMRRGDTPPSAD